MNKKENIDKLIQNHVLMSAGAGLLPLPLLDVAAITAIQLDLLVKITESYELSFKDTQLKAFIAALGGGILSGLGGTVAQLIPGIGILGGKLTTSALAGSSTYAIAQAYIKYLEDGGSFLDFKADDYKKYFNEQLEKGKEYMKKLDLSKEGKQEHTIEKLREIAVLRDNGTITEEEFQTLKSKLISDF